MAEQKPIPLGREQMAASDPDGHVWLNASAGTGKTFVLAARVLRLLLRRAEPESILCLTFTRAGAAEMANRIHDRLADWVQMDEDRLYWELVALGEESGPDARDHARTLFARVLDATGGGLRIQTIHSFCQQLLASFPVEADLVPGFRPLEEREQAQLAHETLAALLADADMRGDTGLIAAVQALSIRYGEQDAAGFLLACARHVDALRLLPSPIQPWLFARLGLGDGEGDVEAKIIADCADCDEAAIRWIAARNGEWGTKGGLGRQALCLEWLALDADERAAGLAQLHGVWATGKGEPRSTAKGQAPQVDGYDRAMEALFDWANGLLALRSQAAYAAFAADALEAGRAYALAYHDAKRLAGVVDFDDLIDHTVALLSQSDMADWIRYKLDQTTDHVLVDEAQDTNDSQWDIVHALAGEYFAGLGSKDGKRRTLFTVGDHKQAIYSFQGTSPQAFRKARTRFDLTDDAGEPMLAELSLDRSFRSTPAVLQVVDATVAAVTPEALGLEPGIVRHDSAREYPGEVMLWRPTTADPGDDDSRDDGEESWAADHVREHASRIAKQIRAWIADGLFLHSKGRPIRAGDVMILVRTRGEMARLLVARLYEEGVPVAGIDRLRLDAPLAVRDLLAALRFVLQPDDDLNLATLLVSPLMGWTQDDLMRHAPRDRISLWRHLRATLAEAPAVLALGGLLGGADFTTPYRYLEQLLSGPLAGRSKLLSRLGEEARDHIDELLNQALAFERSGPPSLQRFLDWFDRGEVHVKRDAAEAGQAVRVLTVHGAKGLQAPVVILADATADPDAGSRREWAKVDLGAGPMLLPPQRAAEMFGEVGEAQQLAKADAMREWWRLLYVAMTRAEEKLIVSGALGPRCKGVPPEKSWYAAVARAMTALGAVDEDNAVWGRRTVWHGPQGLPSKLAEPDGRAAAVTVAEPPSWLWQHAPAERRPSRPLAPSAQPEDASMDPPPNAAMKAAAERGKWLHALFERLPALPPEQRREAADRWLERQARLTDPVARAHLIADALAVIDDPRFADVFSPGSLAEAPIVAVVGEQVIAGTVDRLCVGAERILVVDFKTGRRAPGSVADVPPAHLRQMAAYVVALQAIFPGRVVQAALLYTATPILIILDDADIAPHKPGYAEAQHNF